MELTLDQALQKGIEAHKAGQIQEAYKFYTAILQSKPKHPDANHNMGVLAIGSDKAQEALPFFEMAVKENPKIVQFWLSYIDALLKLDRFSDARAVVNQAHDKGIKGDSFDQLQQRINELDGNDTDVESGFSTEAKSLYEDIPVRFSKNKKATDGIKVISGELSSTASGNQNPSPEKLHSLINLYSQGQLQQTLDQVAEMLKEFPRSLTLYNICGATHARLGKFGAAIESYEKAIKIKPDYAESYNNMGIAQKEKGEIDTALKSYEHALRIKPDFAEAYYNMGIALKEKNELLAAIESYKQATNINPDYAEAYNNMGIALKDKGDLDAAIESYKKAIKIKPDYAEAHNNMGTTLKDKGELNAAVELYKRILTINPYFAAVYNNMGIALRDKGELNAAIESCKQAIRINPDYAEAHNNMGIALKDKGDLHAAIESYKKAIKINPDNAESYYNLGMLFFEMGQYKKAAQNFKLSDFSISDFSISEAYYLRCLYLLDEKSNFYKQLDYLVSEGEVNAMIGSLSSRSKIKYGLSRQNPFCNDPLKYVLHTDLKEKYDFTDTFVTVAKNILATESMEYKDQGHLTNGIQTAGNFFNQEGDLIDNIKAIIHSEIDKYLANFKNSKEGFIKNWPSDYGLQGWLVSMNSGGTLSAHMHETGWITGSIYINIPQKAMADSGNLVVCIEDPQNITDKNIESPKIIDVNTGSLCLFPSSLLHYTIPFVSTEERIVLAFDMVPK